MKDFYYILGTARDASATEIEAAYQKLARKFMDEQDSFMNDHFREIAEAYDVLRDERRRRRYDAALRRSQKRYIAAFKLRYLNIGITLMFLTVTVLFAGYVIRNLQGHPKKVMPQSAAQPVASAITSAAHIKKHHKTASAAAPLKQHLIDVPDASTIIPAPHAELVTPPDFTNITILHANVTGIIYLHQSPDYGSAVLAKLPDATEVRVLQKGNAWYKVSYNGQEGYVIKSAVGR